MRNLHCSGLVYSEPCADPGSRGHSTKRLSCCFWCHADPALYAIHVFERSSWLDLALERIMLFVLLHRMPSRDSNSLRRPCCADFGRHHRKALLQSAPRPEAARPASAHRRPCPCSRQAPAPPPPGVSACAFHPQADPPRLRLELACAQRQQARGCRLPRTRRRAPCRPAKGATEPHHGLGRPFQPQQGLNNCC